MTLSSLRSARFFRIGAVSLLVFCGLASIAAAAEIVDPTADYLSWDRLHNDDDFINSRWPEACQWYGDSVAMFEKGSGLEIVDPTTGSVQWSLGQPDSYFDSYSDFYNNEQHINVWASFLKPDPNEDAFWVGFTMLGDTDDRIYRVDFDGNWTHMTTLTGNDDLEFHGNDAFASANPGASQSPFQPETGIYLLDSSGTTPTDETAHQLVAEVGGYSSGLGVDSQGNIYYGTYNTDSGSNEMLRFAVEDINETLSTSTPLTLADAETLFDLTLGASDVDVDAADHVIFNGNDADGNVPGYIASWSEDTQTTETIATTSSDDAYWLTLFATKGNMTGANGGLLAVDYYHSGFGEIRHETSEFFPGDANNDGTVDARDFAWLMDSWQQTGKSWYEADFNGDQIVDARDFAYLMDNWQQTAPTNPTSVPEPAASVLLMGLGLLLHRSRKNKSRSCKA